MRTLRFDSDLLDDAVFYIEKLNCPKCSFRTDFYLQDLEPYCLCCDSELDITVSDVLSVIGRDKRSPILRFASRVA